MNVDMTIVFDDQKMHDLANEMTASLQPISAGRLATLRFALTLMRCAVLGHGIQIEHGWAKCIRCCWRERLPDVEVA